MGKIVVLQNHVEMEQLLFQPRSKALTDDGRKVTYTFDHQEFYHIDDEISSHFQKNMNESNLEDHDLTPFLFGGLRVKEIKEDFQGDTTFTKFDYTIDGKEDGKLVITHYSHAHHGYGHKTSGNHCVRYENVNVTKEKVQ